MQSFPFPHVPHGCLPSGTVTPLGTIEQTSCTAYLIAGRWVPFTRLHGPRAAVTPLVMLGGTL
jgi:hypothetical protein